MAKVGKGYEPAPALVVAYGDRNEARVLFMDGKVLKRKYRDLKLIQSVDALKAKPSESIMRRKSRLHAELTNLHDKPMTEATLNMNVSKIIN